MQARHLQHLLRRARRDDARAARRGDQAHGDGAALARNLGRHGVHAADLVPPVAAADGHHRHLGGDDRAADGGRDLLRALDAEADVPVGVADAHEGLEARALAGARLLLDRHDLHDLVLEGGPQEVFDDLVLLDGHGEEVDLLEGLDLALVFWSWVGWGETGGRKGKREEG